MSEDIHIGFLEEPKGLEKFLEGEGYEEEDRSGETIVFANQGITIFYYPEAFPPEDEDDEDELNWQRAGYNVIAELNINFNRAYYKKSGAIRDKILKRFKRSVLFDGDDYYPGEA